MLADRLPGHGEPVDDLKSRSILLDGSWKPRRPRLLLQIFGQTVIGPVSFNSSSARRMKASARAISPRCSSRMELDQIRRGALNVEEARRMTSPIKLGGVHHAAYRCKDAKETVEWYEAMLGMTYTTAFAEDHVPSTGRP